MESLERAEGRDLPPAVSDEGTTALGDPGSREAGHELRDAPRECPACRHRLHITTLACSACGTRVTGTYSLCSFCRLDEETRRLLEGFLRARGNIRELQRELGVSYPTARARLETLWSRLGLQKQDAPQESAEAILAELRDGAIDVSEAAVRLRRRSGLARRNEGPR